MAIQRSVGSWLVLIYTGSYLVGCSSEPEVRDENYIPDGKKLYMNNCASCHGETGDEGTSDAFELTEMTLDRDSIRKVILMGRNGMPPFEYIISDSVDLEALIDHVENLKK